MPRRRRGRRRIEPWPACSTPTCSPTAEPSSSTGPLKEIAINDAPDPLGKRALFWAPAERDDDGPRRRDERDIPGKHALFSASSDPAAPADPSARSASPSRRRYSTGTARGGPAPGAGRASRGAPSPVARRTLGGGATESATAVAGPVPAAAADRGAGGRRSVISMAPVTLECSTCGAVREVDVLEYMVLHLPVWLWRPGRGYSRYMTCPACRRRTWVSASWSPWSR